MFWMPELEPGARLGRWQVVERLGMGGQGQVFRVEDPDHPGDFFALKLARHPHDARAEREAALLLTRAVHPGVARIQGFAHWPHPRDGVLGLLMDWVPGPPIHLWAESGVTTFRQLATVGAQVARTLGELHARGVLHRDLKPEHIVLREPDGQPTLLDFGVGWFEGADPLTTGPLPPATLHMLSPEAVRFLWESPARPGQHYRFQPTDDLYALGVCLYRAATGHYPFPEFLPTHQLQYAIVHHRLLAPRALNPRVPRALSEVIERLLSKKPQERYGSGIALQGALAAASQGGAEWDTPVFEFEEATETKPRRIRRPEWPSGPWVEPRSRLQRMMGRRSERSWRMGLLLALLCVLLPGALERHEAPAPAASTWDWSSGARDDSTQSRAETEPLPFPHQKSAPCTAEFELELSGACWLPLEHRPPRCPPQAIAYKARCLLPVATSRPVPVSGDAGAPMP